jgi:hypothetical protein
MLSFFFQLKAVAFLAVTFICVILMILFGPCCSESTIRLKTQLVSTSISDHSSGHGQGAAGESQAGRKKEELCLAFPRVP